MEDGNQPMIEEFLPLSLSLSCDKNRESRGGYDCTLVSPPPLHIQTECSVCLQILKEPCIISCCGHKFCRECIEQVKTSGKDCPLCNSPDFSFMCEHSLDRTLKDLDVFCTHQTEGCEWTGKLRELESHLNGSSSQAIGCQFVEVDCLYQCGEFLQRRFITAHQTGQCKRRPYSCDYCRDFSSTFQDVTDNHYSTCSKYPIPCPNECPAHTLERQNMAKHLESECTLAVVSCPFQYAGCDVSLPRRDMSEHTRDMSTHFMLLGCFTQQLAQENRDLRSQIVRIEEEAKKEQTALCEKLSKLSSACCISNHHIQHCELSERESGKGYMHVTTVSCSTIEMTQEMELRRMYFSVLPYKFRIENFLSYKGGPVVYSPVFYTHPFGYKFRLKVFRTQYSKVLSLDAFTSVYVEIMAGPFDDTLKWPFKGSVTVQIVNQLSDCNHYEKTLHFSDRTYQNNRIKPGDGVDIMSGMKAFIYHKRLRYEHCVAGKRTHYLQDGSLYIRVTKIHLSCE